MKKVLIVEDEYLLADELEERLVELDPNIQICGKLESIKETVAWLKNNVCDLLFLDIHLNDGLSFSIFEQVEINCPIIFITAYDEYAIKAFDVNSIAYLLKPFGDEDLRNALQKHKTWEEQHFNIQELLHYTASSPYIERITLSIGNIQKPFLVNEVAYFMAEDRFVFAISFEGKRYFYKKALYQLEKELNPKDFFRVNRTFILNYKSIIEFTPYSKGRLILQVHPKAEKQIIVSSENTKKLRKWLTQ